jgi:hypothetical protein
LINLVAKPLKVWNELAVRRHLIRAPVDPKASRYHSPRK